MKLPKRLVESLVKKQNYIDIQRTKMEGTVVKLQSNLYARLIKELIPELDVKDGIIQETAKNYRLISVLDKTYKDFQVKIGQVFIAQISGTTRKIVDLSKTYFELMLSDQLPARFEKIIATTDKLINLRIGLENGKFIRGGFLQSFFESNTLGTELKDMTSKAVTSHANLKDYVSMLSDKINGTDEYTGGLDRQFQRYGYDLYQQYDRAYNASIGNEFGYKYFIYQGGLIGDSRDFCAAHNNKVWSIDEAQDWALWTPSKGEYPSGYEVKAKDIYSVPSYLGYAGYDPLIDFGGYNCRHFAGWIPDELAFEMRPNLKE